MSEYAPRLGDRVRVVLDGKVTHVYSAPSSAFSLEGVVIDPSILPAASVERLSDPLPTTPGSVVEVKGLGFYTLHADGMWYGQRRIPVLPHILSGYDHRIAHDEGRTS